MKRLFALIVFALAISPAAALAQGGHEYSPLVEKTVNYKNWTLNDLKDNKPVDLRSLVAGKKLVMVVYFAPWCPNWRNEAPVAARLYEKYKDQGFAVIGVSEYGTRDEVQQFLWTSRPALSGGQRIGTARGSQQDSTLRLPAVDRRHAKLGIAVEYFSRAGNARENRRRADRKSLGR